MDRSQVVLRLLMFSGLLIGLMGCTRDTGREAVTGNVTFKGQPLDHGTIAFYPQSDSPEAYFEGSVIVDGRYEVPTEKGLLPGKYKVMISSGDHNEKDMEAEMLPGESGRPAKERIPAKYNTKSEEFIEVKPGGPNEFNYTIE